MVRLLSLDEAEEITAPCHDAWLRAHRETIKKFNGWRREIPELFLPLGEPEYCAIIHRHVFARAAQLLDGKVVSSDRLGFNYQVVGGRALVRFKHLDAGLVPRAYGTRQQRRLDHQTYTEDMMEQLVEDGVQSLPTLLTCGYRMSPTWDKLVQVAVVCRYEGYQYHFDLHNESGEFSQEVVPLPGMPPPAPTILPKEPKEAPATGDEEME